MDDELVELGFMEVSEPWRLNSYLFPSKVGGKPAWLNLEKLPCTSQDLQCKKCGNTMIFLCQLYAPFEENANISTEQFLNNFHRTIFVFICRNGECCDRNNSENIKVLRCSLKRDNKFYSFDPPSEETPNLDFSLKKWAHLCQVCGSGAEHKCSKCKDVYYCSKHHQVLDWKTGHKHECETEMKCSRKSKILFEEGEIVTESEELFRNDEAELEKYKKMAQKNECEPVTNYSEKDLEAYAAQETDEVFRRFQERIKYNPEQIIRYKKGGKPLWIAKDPLPENIPNCEYCYGPRQFEFQIMPQMLTMLKENDIDWGVIAVYTCMASCTDTSGYKNEFVFKQDVQLNNEEIFK